MSPSLSAIITESDLWQNRTTWQIRSATLPFHPGLRKCEPSKMGDGVCDADNNDMGT